MRRSASCCSKQWAVQPAVLPMAKVGVKSPVGSPRPCSRYLENPAVEISASVAGEVRDLIGERPTVDLGLVTLGRSLGLPAGGAVALFALGRTVGWIGHAIEQYQSDALIRPRARYVGEPVG